MLYTCCFCISLYMGTVIIAIISIVWNIILILLSIIMLAGGLDSLRQYYENDLVSQDVWFTICILTGFLNIATDAALIFGARQGIKFFTYPWLISHAFALLLTFCVLTLGIYQKKIDMAFQNLFLLVIQLYCYMVVYSFFRFLDEQDDE